METGVAVGLLGGEVETGVEVGNSGGKVAVGGARVGVPIGVSVGWNMGVAVLMSVGGGPIGVPVAVLFTGATGVAVAGVRVPLAGGLVTSTSVGDGPSLGVGVGVAGSRPIVRAISSSTPVGVRCSRAMSVAA